jgi:histone H3/H4
MADISKAPRKLSFETYIYKMLRNYAGPKAGMDSESIQFMDEVLINFMNRIINQANSIREQAHRSALRSTDIEQAIRTIVPREFNTVLTTAGTNAVNNANA